MGDLSDESQCELNFFKSNQFLLVVASSVTFFIFLILICLVLQGVNKNRLKTKYRNESQFAIKENIAGSLKQSEYVNEKKLTIKKKSNQLSSFTLQTPHFPQSIDSNELKTSQNFKTETTLTSFSPSSSSSLLNKQMSEHFQLETFQAEPKENQSYSTYKPQINNKVTILKSENGSLMIRKPSDLSRTYNADSQTVNMQPMISAGDSSDKKSCASNTYACSQITTDGSMQSQFKGDDDDIPVAYKQNNSSVYTDDGSSTLRRNSYTKAIFFDNL